MIHYRCDTSSYRQLLGFIKQELRESIQLTIGSDGDQSIQSAVKQTFPKTIHLHCTRHVKKNIERHLLKTQLVLQDRQKLLDLVFDSPESLIQAETEHQYDERLNNLRDVCSRIRESSLNQDQSSMANFYTWFLRYQNDNFRNHLIKQKFVFGHRGPNRLPFCGPGLPVAGLQKCSLPAPVKLFFQPGLPV